MVETCGLKMCALKVLQKRPEWGAEPGPMCYLQSLCVETQRENRRCGREEACAVAPYVGGGGGGKRLWATHQGHTTSPPGTCNLGGTIINPKVTAVQALGRVG